MSETTSILAISVGNTRAALGVFERGELIETHRFSNDDITPLIEAAVERWADIANHSGASVVMASVNDPVAERIRSALEDQLSVNIYIIGDDIPIPIGRQLDPETITGVDRLLNAAAAFDVLKQACVVVDVGTAVTVDFVDGGGIFHGGAIAPGAQMQLDALHDRTAALPELSFAAPQDDAFGRNTAQAMLQGVYHGIRGMVRLLTEQYAEQYGAYPLIIATGGDAHMLFAHDELMDRVVDDLALRGIAVSMRYAMNADSESR